MTRFLADENLRGPIIRGVKRREPAFDVVRAQDVGLTARPDPEVLAWALENDRILVSQDLATMENFARERLNAGLEIAGLLLISERVPVAVAIEELVLIIKTTEQSEWRNQIAHLPL